MTLCGQGRTMRGSMNAQNPPAADLQTELEHALREAVVAALGPEHAEVDPMVRPSGNPQFGDYQANLAMSLAKQVGQKPRDVAQGIVEKLAAPTLIAETSVAGPGFINLKLTTSALETQAAALLADERLGVTPAEPPERVVVDYSGPNVAKEMHVGHLRSTVIGDAIARTLEFRGQEVIRQNHLGDWGTQFGMLVEFFLTASQDELAEAGVEAAVVPVASSTGTLPSGTLKLADDTQALQKFYQAAKRTFDESQEFAERARERVVLLQSGEPQTMAIWQAIINASKRHFNAVYRRLNVGLSDADVRGESSYNDDLPQVIEALQEKDLLKESEGAAVVFPQGFKDREGNPLPMIVRKSGGGYLYATTDLAAARYRIKQLGAKRIIYVTDARQAQHFAMMFETLRKAGWAGDEVRLDHVPFGTVLGADRKPFKTRSGDTVRLMDLLDEAESRAEQVIADKNRDLSETQRKEIARIVGIGGLKYADLSTDRIKDYIFDWDRMLALDGNTAPYLQNAYVRIRSIFRKAQATGVDLSQVSGDAIRVGEPAERALVLKLVQFAPTVASVADTLEPHRLCNYLYELASSYHQFYEHCPVLTAPDEATRTSRLALSDLVARTLKTGLGLLGIETVEQM